MGKNNNGVDNTVAAVENADRTKGGEAALQVLNDQLTAYKNGTDGSGPHTEAEVKQYWAAVQQQLKEDNVLPDLAVSWGRSELRNDFFDAGEGISEDDLRDLRRDGRDPSASFYDIFEADMAGVLLEGFDDVRGATENKVGGFLGIGAQDNANITLEDITESLNQIDSKNFMRPLLEEDGAFFKSLDVYGDGVITKEDLQTYVDDAHHENDEYRAFANKLLKNWDDPATSDPDGAQVQRLLGDFGITANGLAKAAGFNDDIWSLEDLQKEYDSRDIVAPETTSSEEPAESTESTESTESAEPPASLGDPATTASTTNRDTTADSAENSAGGFRNPAESEDQSRDTADKNVGTPSESYDPTTYGPLEFAMRAQALQKLADSSLVTSSADSYKNVARRMLGLAPTENSQDIEVLADALEQIHPAPLRGEDQGGPLLTLSELDKLLADPESYAVISKRLEALVEEERSAIKTYWENNSNPGIDESDQVDEQDTSSKR